MKKIFKKSLLLLLIGVSSQIVVGQSTEKSLTISELFSLTKENHPRLVVAKADVEIAAQQVKVAKSNYTPSLSVGIQAFYLGDVNVLDKDFSHLAKQEMPHFGNSYSVEARQLLWKGNSVRNAVKVQSLSEEIAQLSYTTNEQAIQLLVLGYYLDLYKLRNQAQVYEKNINLAHQRLTNIQRFEKQGMVTRNDVIRGELQVSNLKLALQVVQNNQQILNNQLVLALGLPIGTVIVPTEKVLPESQLLAEEQFQQQAKQHPTLQIAQRGVELRKTATKITRASFMPSLSAFAGNTLQRPITTSTPVRDMYANNWRIGISLNFNLDDIYKGSKKLQQNRWEQTKAEAQLTEAQQNVNVAVTAAYIKYQEAITQNETLKTNRDLANENYRIMESKYNHQLAILLDLIDASNAKLDAELQFANSEITMVNAYYKLLKETGTL